MASPKYSFVSYDLNTSLDAARKLWENRGTAPASSLELSVLQGFASASSGSYLTRLANVRAFGLLEGPSSALKVTPLALRILQPEYPEDETRARIEAFESIPLFKAFLSRYHGQTLPPVAGMINALQVQFGIDPEKSKFVLTRLLDSAEQAGLFAAAGARTKLVRQTLSVGLAKPADESLDNDPASSRARAEREAAEATARNASADPLSPRMNKIVDGSLDLLPTGSWTETGLAQWLGFFEDALRVYYGLPKEPS
ncbi:MAG TPA: hypothetical protein VNE42_02900 [Acidimicrobiales bacterium]|nr:hypothetical protein [Acidimicrobiales bacterium]